VVADSNKAAAFVYSVPGSCNLVARDEFNHTSLVISFTRLGCLYFQPQPALLGIETDLCWSGIRMPALEQIVRILRYVGAITGSHECQCGRRGFQPGQDRTTTAAEWSAAVAGAGFLAIHDGDR